MAESVSEFSSALVPSNLAMNEFIKVLQVDDDPSSLRIAKQILEMQGRFQVETASSVGEAIERMKIGDFDVIVSDLKMPGKDGLEFLKELRERGNSIPFILFTGKGREEVAVEALNLGADGYFNKTGHPETVYGELAHGIRHAVKIRKAEEHMRESEEKFRNLAEQSPNMIFINQKGRVVYANKEAEDAMGYKKEEFYSPDFNFLSLIAPKSRELIRLVYERQMKGEDIGPLEYKLITRDGRTLDVMLTSKPIMYEGDNAILGTVTDITEHKRLEGELFDKQTKLQNIFAASPDAFMVTDLKGNVIECSERALKVLRYSSKEEVIGKSAFVFLATKDRQRATHSLENTLMDGLTRNVQYTAVSKDDHEFPIELSASVVRDVSGEPTGFVAIVRDITERRKAEEEIRSLSKFPSEDPNPVLRIATDGTILYTNAATKSLLSELKAETGQPAPHHWRPLVADAINSGLRKEFEVEHRGRIFLFTLMPVTDSAYVNVYGLDITKRKQEKKELRESEKRYRAIFEGATDGILAADPETTRFVFANPTICRLTGYSEKELLNMKVEDIHPEEQRPYATTEFEKLARGNIPRTVAIPVLRKDRSVICCDINTAHLKVGKRNLLVGFFRDTTERQKSLEKLKILNEKLDVVGKLTRHDVKNRLSAVVGNIYLARKTLPSDHKALASLREIESACEQTVRILDFAATYEMLGVEELTLVGVDKIVNEAVSLLSDLQGARVINECHGLTVMTDPLLRQLFYNLIDNSLKHGENVSQIRVHYEEGKEGLKLFYEDDGVGIPKAMKPKIFAKGFTMGKGSGYGLHLAKKIIEAYGWTVEETGETGKGAKFVITIPRTNPNGRESYVIGR